MKAPEIHSRWTALLWFLLPGVSVALSVYVRIRLLGLPLERDEGELAYLGRLLLKGVPPFATAYSMKLPGIFAAYALIMEFFGQTAAGIRSGLLAVNLATVVLVYWLGKRLYDHRTGAVAAGAYALLSVSQTVYGVVAHATHFVVFFSLVGFLCLLESLDRRSRWLVFASGLSFGLSFTMKQHAAPILLFALCFVVYRCWREGASPRALTATGLAFTCGAAVPLLGWAAYLGIRGVLGASWFWTVSYAARYATNTTLPEAARLFADQSRRLVSTTGLLWLAAAFQSLLIMVGRDRRGGGRFVLGLLAASCAAVTPGYYFRPHYFVMVLPPVALFIGAFATWPLRSASPESGSSLKRAVVAVLIAAFAATIVFERAYLFDLSPPQVSRAIYLANPFPESPVIAEYLRRNTSPADRIAILGSEPQILFYADRSSATGYLCTYPLMEEQPFADRMQEQMIREIEAARPKYVVFVNVAASWLPRPRSHLAVFDWSAAYLSQQYELDGVVDLLDPRTTLMWWGAEAAVHPPKARNHLLLYRRKARGDRAGAT